MKQEQRNQHHPHAECPCPNVDLRAWEDTTVAFRSKPFLARRIPRFLRVPVGLYDEILSLFARAAALRIALGIPPMVLERERGIFRGELLLSVREEGDFPGRRLLTGLYRASVHRSSAARLGSAARRFVSRLEAELGVKPGEVFLWHVNCPRCWARKGGPAVVILARIGTPHAEEKHHREAEHTLPHDPNRECR